MCWFNSRKIAEVSRWISESLVHSNISDNIQVLQSLGQIFNSTHTQKSCRRGQCRWFKTPVNGFSDDSLCSSQWWSDSFQQKRIWAWCVLLWQGDRWTDLPSAFWAGWSQVPDAMWRRLKSTFQHLILILRTIKSNPEGIQLQEKFLEFQKKSTLNNQFKVDCKIKFNQHLESSYQI